MKRNFLSTHVLFSTKPPLHFNIRFFQITAKNIFTDWVLTFWHLLIYKYLENCSWPPALIRSQHFICDTSHKCRAAAKFKFTSTCQDHFQQQQHIRWGKVKHLNFWLMITYTALFSTLPSRFTVLACDSTWVTSSFFFSAFWISTKALTWLVPHETAAVSAQVPCTPRGVEIRVSTKSRPWRRKFSHCSCRDSNPRPFNHKSDTLTTDLSLLQLHELPDTSFACSNMCAGKVVNMKPHLALAV